MKRTIPILVQMAFLVVACYTVPIDLHWTPNNESDINSYEVWRMDGSEPYQIIDGAVPHVPVQVEIAPGVFEQRILFLDDTPTQGNVAVYKTKAVDDCQNRSIFSDESVQIRINDGIDPDKPATPGAG